MRTNPDVVLVDSEVIVKAPPRFFIAGIGDALSKKFEAGQCAGAGGVNFYGGMATRLALTVADCCFDILMEKGEEAAALVREGRGGPVVEDVIEATILMSGLAFESGGLSIAHALQRGFTRLPQLSGYLHGELVALGLLVQLAAEQRDDRMLEDVVGLCRRLALPTALSDVGAEIADAETIARAAIETAPYIGNFSRPVTANVLCGAFSRLEEMRRG